MNKKILSKLIFGASLLLLTACSQDEFSDGQGEPLPEGKYPLQIASVSMNVQSDSQQWSANAPQTRVTENTDGNSSVWQNGDKISVQIGNGTPGTYTYTDANLTMAGGDTPAYWASKDNGQNITAWYTNPGYTNGNDVDLSDQTKGLAYVITAQKTADFNQSVSLTFSHKLAKVRVELIGEIASFMDNVSIKSYTTCSFTQGQGTLGNGADEGEIKMYKVSDRIFEANVVPGHEIKEFMVTNGTTWSTLATTVTPEAGKTHKIAIEVTGGTTINLSEQGDVYTVESGKHVVIDGGSSTLQKRIIIPEGARVMLKNVILAAPTTDDNTIEINGSATLLLSGTNEIKASKNKCPLAVTSGTLTINGTDNDKLTLTGEGGYTAGCLGLYKEASLIINGGDIVADGSKTQHGSGIGSYWTADFNPHYGSITINGGKIEASGGGNSAGIGSGRQCGGGDIIITGGYITVTGGEGDWGGAGIGSGVNGSCGNITISGKNTVVTATVVKQGCDKIGISSGGSCGTVTIKAGVTVNSTKYTEDHVGRI